ncbi:hypothetical protein [Streptomyces sp. B21-083]|uniref:hypothetical protein n=1 Tax=Streptomyces sp. B21-083 TaxID=3039410 RepID=UPI002FEFFEFD
MTRHRIGLGLFSRTRLPAGLALADGRIPHRSRRRSAPTSPLGRALLALCPAATLHLIQRLVEAPPAIVRVATALAGAVAAAGRKGAALAPRRTRNATA